MEVPRSWDELTQGVRNVKKSSLNARFVFIKPPSIEELERRLRIRASETHESIQERLEAAKRELSFAEEYAPYDKVIINDDTDTAYAELESFVLSN
jgi:guanylate kinase